jgi:hypothetical protein
MGEVIGGLLAVGVGGGLLVYLVMARPPGR